jgi:hypothetical protein
MRIMVTDLVVDSEQSVPYLKILYYGGVGISKKIPPWEFYYEGRLKGIDTRAEV